MLKIAQTQPGTMIRTAIVGYGLSGSVFHVPFLEANPAFTVSAIVTADATRRRRAAAKHPEAHIYRSFEELESQPDAFDLIVLASPPNNHFDLAMRSLELGNAVVVDKPFVSSVADAQTLINAASRAKRPLMVFQNRRWDGDFLTLRSLIESGRLGRVFHFESNFEHWAPEVTSGWKDHLPASSAGGVAFDLGSHLVDQALVLFGPAVAVTSRLRTVRDGGGNDDHAEIHLEHESGTVSRLLMSRASHAQGPRFRALGTRGSFISYGLDPQEPALVDGASPTDPGFGTVAPEFYGTLTESTPSGSVTSRIPTESGNYAEFYRLAAIAVRGDGPVPIALSEAVAVVAVLEEAGRSSRGES